MSESIDNAIYIGTAIYNGTTTVNRLLVVALVGVVARTIARNTATHAIE